eukprot:Skav216289  [mRNA]  locus=scaffold494:61327:62361:- [translate_table: standard]
MCGGTRELFEKRRRARPTHLTQATACATALCGAGACVGRSRKEMEDPSRRALLSVVAGGLAVAGVNDGLKASDERFAAFGTILAPAPYKETIRTELVPGRIWGFEQCIALASVSTNIRMTVVKLQD